MVEGAAQKVVVDVQCGIDFMPEWEITDYSEYDLMLSCENIAVVALSWLSAEDVADVGVWMVLNGCCGSVEARQGPGRGEGHGHGEIRVAVAIFDDRKSFVYCSESTDVAITRNLLCNINR